MNKDWDSLSRSEKKEEAQKTLKMLKKDAFMDNWMPWIILFIIMTVWANFGWIWALGSGIILMVMYGWKDRYKGLEHLKPKKKDDNTKDV